MVEMDGLARQLRDSLALVLKLEPSLIEDAMLTALEHPNRVVNVAVTGEGDALAIRFGKRRGLHKGKFWTVSMTVQK